jgi:hypothetical protein
MFSWLEAANELSRAAQIVNRESGLTASIGSGELGGTMANRLGFSDSFTGSIYRTYFQPVD